MEKTFAIIKPDGVERNLIGKILERIESNGFKIVAMKRTLLSKAQAEGLNVKIDEPNVWISQVQGPRSMELLDLLTKTNRD